jgi:hypothetical protein
MNIITEMRRMMSEAYDNYRNYCTKSDVTYTEAEANDMAYQRNWWSGYEKGIADVHGKLSEARIIAGLIDSLNIGELAQLRLMMYEQQNKLEKSLKANLLGESL